MSGTEPAGAAEGSFERLEECAVATARTLIAEGRPFDAHPTAPPGASSRHGFLGLGRTRTTRSMKAWRLDSLLLLETTVGAGEQGTEALVRYERSVDELWLGADGAMVIISFRFERTDPPGQLTYSSQPLSRLTAARYDSRPEWRQRQSVRGADLVHEGWLEMLGRPWFAEPLAAVGMMLGGIARGPAESVMFAGCPV